MVIDAHCHAYRHWPDQPPVPDPAGRGAVEQLLFEMDLHGVDQAVLVCSCLPGNLDNNDYAADCVRRYPGRLHQMADVDSRWSARYHAPGVAQRLRAIVARFATRGITHYVAEDDDGSWYLSPEGVALMASAADLRQIVSLALPARLQPILRQLAARFPTVPVLCHHMAEVRAPEQPPYPLLREVLLSASVPNIYVKVSGFHYVSAIAWEYPYADCRRVVRALYEHFGADRLCWGSDYPALRRAMTYQQSLEAFRTHCAFIPAEHQARILGGNLQRLLAGGAA